MNYRSIEIYFNGILKIPVDREVKYYVNVGSRWLYTGGGESADMLLTLVSTSLFAFLKKKLANAFVHSSVILPRKTFHSTSCSEVRVRRLF